MPLHETARHKHHDGFNGIMPPFELSLRMIKHLSQQLAFCLNTDRHVFKRQLDSVRSESKKGKNVEAALSALAGRIEKSVARRNQRLASIPPLNFPDLPVTGKKDDIAELIKANLTRSQVN